MEFNEIVSACLSAGYEVRGYVGRGRRGECLAITTDRNSVTDVVLDIISTHISGVRDNRPVNTMGLCEALKNSQTDSMGKGMVIYWPQIKWEPDADEDISLEPSCGSCDDRPNGCAICNIDD